MKRFFAAAGLFAGVTLMVAAPAMARTNVDLHIGIGVPGVYAYPAPAPVYPAPVYIQPQPVYVQPYPAYVYPRPAYAYPVHSDWHGGHRHFRNGNPYGDRDRDGVPNRWDHRPNNPYQR